MIKALRIVVFLCLASLASLGQMGSYQYAGSSAYSVVSQNFTACATINCWHANMNKKGWAPQIWVSNGKTFALNSSGVYQLTDYPNYSWVLHPEWGAVAEVQADAAGNIFALTSNGCGVANTMVAQWNGSSFVNVTGCLKQFWMGAADGILGIDLNNNLWIGSVANSITQVAPPEAGHTFLSASWVSDTRG